jgi:hypothetical protein
MRGILQQFFKRSDGTTICILACFTALILFAACSSTAAGASAPSEPIYNVVSPIGESTVKMTSMAPRIDTLAGNRASIKKAIPRLEDYSVYRFAQCFSAGTSRYS